MKRKPVNLQALIQNGLRSIAPYRYQIIINGKVVELFDGDFVKASLRLDALRNQRRA